MEFLPLNKYMKQIIKLYVDYSIENIKKNIPKTRHTFHRSINRSMSDIIVLCIQLGYCGVYIDQYLYSSVKENCNISGLKIIEFNNMYYFKLEGIVDDLDYVDINHLNVINYC